MPFFILQDFWNSSRSHRNSSSRCISAHIPVLNIIVDNSGMTSCPLEKTDEISAHFLGSIVCIEKGLYQVSSQPPLLVIDENLHFVSEPRQKAYLP